MKTNLENVLLTDKSRDPLDGPGGWMSGWLLHGTTPQGKSGGNKAAEVS